MVGAGTEVGEAEPTLTPPCVAVPQTHTLPLDDLAYMQTPPQSRPFLSVRFAASSPKEASFLASCLLSKLHTPFKACSSCS